MSPAQLVADGIKKQNLNRKRLDKFTNGCVKNFDTGRVKSLESPIKSTVVGPYVKNFGFKPRIDLFFLKRGVKIGKRRNIQRREKS